MFRVLLLATAFAWSGPLLANPDADDGPIEIDLSPLPGTDNKTEFRFHLTIKGADGKELVQDYKIGANTDTSDVAELIYDSLPKEFDAKRDGSKLIVTSFNGKPVTKVVAETTGLAKDAPQPKVRRLPKKEPEKQPKP